MKIFTDMSSLMWTGLLAGTDPEALHVTSDDGKTTTVATCAYGYENTVNSLVKALNEFNLAPKDLVMVFEGRNSTAMRKLINSSYKANRAKRVPEAYEQFSMLADKLKETFRKLGALALTNASCEGDDTLAFLARETEQDAVIMTNDSDLIALRGVNAHGATIQVRCSGSTEVNKYGISPELIVIYKSLIGDSSDNIKGVPGFGPKAFETFMVTYGEEGLRELKRLAELGDLSELVSEDVKVVQKIVENEKEFLNSYELACLRPQDVDTIRNNLVWEPGLVSGTTGDERLKHWEAKSYLVTGAKWAGFVNWAQPHIDKSEFVALDIETSSADESDEWLEANGQKVDIIGSELTGMSLTFGDNLQHTVYIPVDHADTDNCHVGNLSNFIMNLGKKLVIHNTNFEGVVLYNTWGEKYLDNGWHGFLPGMLDTKLEASYCNENEGLGLKSLSKRYFDYDQVEYKTVTTLEGPPGTWVDGKLCEREISPAVLDEFGTVVTPAKLEVYQSKQFKMRDLTGAHVKSYACDDTIVTASLHNFFKFMMEIEHHYQVYLNVEIDAAYLHCQSFVHGTRCDLGKLALLAEEDAKTKEAAEQTLHKYLIEKGWDGAIAPVYTELTAANVKEAVLLSTGQELKTMVRKLEKLSEMIEDPLLRELVAANDAAAVTEFVKRRFTAKPEFNSGSPKQLSKLLYDVMDLPVRVRNFPTEAAKARGEKTGTPKTDSLAVEWALRMDATDSEKQALEQLKLIKMVGTRNGLYYNPFPNFQHWKTGRIHSSHNQCSTSTRRASSSAPNLQQLAKSAKIEGQAARIREIFIPHKRNAVIVSMDFVSQEILLMAEWSKDPALEEVFIGTPPKDMHSITATAIYNSKEGTSLSYEEFKAIVDDQHHPLHKTAKKYRALGKMCNFSSQYRTGAAKMASMLFVGEDDAQMMLDAKAEAFPVAEEWSKQQMEAIYEHGTVKSMLGAVRHLRPLIESATSGDKRAPERQALSFLIQGSAAELTKLAEGRMWRAQLEQRFDCQVIGSIHDEIVLSCAIADLHKMIPEAHACMVGNYANMSLPIRSSLSLGRNFYEQIEIGNEPTKEAIDFGLAELEKMQNPVTTR